MQIQKLSVIQNKQIRIARAFKAIPIPELEHEIGIPPIDIHLSAQSLRYQTSQTTIKATEIIQKECRRICNSRWRANQSKTDRDTPDGRKRKWARQMMTQSLLGREHTWETATKADGKTCS